MMNCVCWPVVGSRWLLSVSELKKGVDLRKDSNKAMIS
jgi:hypothetical protein